MSDVNQQQDILAPFMPSGKFEYLTGAWADCLSWAIGYEEILTRFRQETGNKWTPGSSVIERMVDEATGADKAFLVEFVKWFNENIWGDPGEGDSEDGN